MSKPSNSVSSNLRPPPPKNYYLKLLSQIPHSEKRKKKRLLVKSKLKYSRKNIRKKLNNFKNKMNKKMFNIEPATKRTEPKNFTNDPELIILDNIQCFSILSKTNGFLKKELEKQNEKYVKTLNYQKLKIKKENCNVETNSPLKTDHSLSVLKLKLNKKEDTWSVESKHFDNKKTNQINDSPEKSSSKISKNKNLSKEISDNIADKSLKILNLKRQNLSGDAYSPKNNKIPEETIKKCRKSIMTGIVDNDTEMPSKSIAKKISKSKEPKQKLASTKNSKLCDSDLNKISPVKFAAKELNISENLSNELNIADNSKKALDSRKRNLSDNSYSPKNNKNQETTKKCRKSIMTGITENGLNDTEMPSKSTTKKISKYKEPKQKLASTKKSKLCDSELNKISPMKFVAKEPNIFENVLDEFNIDDNLFESLDLKKSKSKLPQRVSDKMHSLLKMDQIKKNSSRKCEEQIITDYVESDLKYDNGKKSLKIAATKRTKVKKKLKPKEELKNVEISKLSGTCEEQIISHIAEKDSIDNSDTNSLKVTLQQTQNKNKLASKKRPKEQTNSNEYLKKKKRKLSTGKTNSKIAKPTDAKTKSKLPINNKSRRGPIVRVTKVNSNKKSKHFSQLNLMHDSEILNKVDEDNKKKKLIKNEAHGKQFKSNISILKKMKDTMQTKPDEWRCIFCSFGENEKHLGFLYGPYKPLEGTNFKLINGN